MRTPLPWRLKTSPTCLEQYTTPLTEKGQMGTRWGTRDGFDVPFTDICLSNSGRVCSRIGLLIAIPALATKTSILPKSSTTCFTDFCTESASDTAVMLASFHYTSARRERHTVDFASSSFDIVFCPEILGFLDSYIIPKKKCQSLCRNLIRHGTTYELYHNTT
jgi:hypothetical protein